MKNVNDEGQVSGFNVQYFQINHVCKFVIQVRKAGFQNENPK